MWTGPPCVAYLLQVGVQVYICYKATEYTTVYVTLTWHACKYKLHKLKQTMALLSPGMYVNTRYIHSTRDTTLLSPGMHVNTRYINSTRGTEAAPLVKFMYLVFTNMPGESYCRQLGSLLLYLCDNF